MPMSLVESLTWFVGHSEISTHLMPGAAACFDIQHSRDPFSKNLWAHRWNLVKSLSNLTLILMIQSDHNFAHTMTAELSWHVQNCDLIGPLLIMLQQHIFLQGLELSSCTVCCMGSSALFYSWIFIHVSDMMEISLCSIPNHNEIITTKFSVTTVMASW